MITHPFINSSNKFSQSTYVPGTMLGAAVAAVKETDTIWTLPSREVVHGITEMIINSQVWTMVNSGAQLLEKGQ